MKKINLIIAVLTIGIISMFGMNNKEYSISNINYTKGNSNLIGKDVNIKGIDNVKFNIIGVEGKKIRLLSQQITESRYNYNSSSDGDIPVAFENSAAYSVLMNQFSNYKNKISASGGDVSIFNLDLPTIEEFYNLGYLSRGEYDEKSEYYGNLYYYGNESTPIWLFQINNGKAWITKSITKDGKHIYSIYGWTNNVGEWETYIGLISPNYETSYNLNMYGSSIRPVLETSATNLISSDADVMAYANSFATSNTQNNKPVNGNNAQIVKVPSTGIDKPFIFTAVGMAVIIISGITIWTLVKTNKSKKK